MKRRPMKIAAMTALAVLLVGALSLSGRSVAFSQARYAVNATLSRLKNLITGGTPEEPHTAVPEPVNTAEQTPDANRKAVVCAARFFTVPGTEQGLWQSLRDQGIALVKASTDPEAHYAALGREQAESFDASVTFDCLGTCRVIVWEGETAAIATADRQQRRGLALGWLPLASNDGTRIESTFSFHDGQTGFEIPRVSAEDGGTILVRVRGITPTGEDFLILLQIGYAPEP